jgi:transposase
VEAAHGAGRSKKTYLGAQFRRLLVRKGKKRAAIAVGHSIAVIAYHILVTRQPYQDLGVDYYERRNRRIVERRLVHRLEMLGYSVTLHPTSPAA